MRLGFDNSIIFLLKAILFGIATAIAIPKKEYKKFFLWGLLFGGILDVIIIIMLGPILNLTKYQNMGIHGIFGILPFWTPIAWIFVLMLFFYFLPIHRYFLYLYVLGFAIFGYMVGIVLQNMDLYEYLGSYIYFAPITF
ncbi:MAG: hypothetical protein RBT41_10390, partial [Clostridia bacterium]|nr:hypothetical protein [Clostridia bacterium]